MEILLLVAGIFSLQSIPSLSAHTDQDLDVIRAAIGKETCRITDGKYTILVNRTNGNLYGSSDKGLNPEALNDMQQRASTFVDPNHKHSSNPKKIPQPTLCAGIRVVDHKVVEESFGPDEVDLEKQWARFYSAYPQASSIMSVSLPGYSEDRNAAVVEITQSCGPLCGGGVIVELNKTLGGWETVRRVSTHVR